MQHVTTVVGKDFSVLLAALSRVRLPESSSTTLLFSLAPSPTTNLKQLSAFTTSLTERFPIHVGCISAPLPASGRPHLNTCSFSFALTEGIPFRSIIPGHPEIQVGRWHAGRNRDVSGTRDRAKDPADAELGDYEPSIFDAALKDNGKVDWDKVWSLPLSSGPGVAYRLPEELQKVKSSTISSVVYFSDRAPEGITAELQNAFPSADQLGLLASSTPFLTGRPVTLFCNGQVYSNGAVGVALPSHFVTSQLDVSFPPLMALTPPLPVTSSEGNLIISINCGNPTRLLLSAIQKHELTRSGNSAWISKDDAFYVGVVDGSNLSELHCINSGDLSRGTIALDTSMAPRAGSTVQLYRLQCPSTNFVAKASDPSQKPSLSFLVSPEIEHSSFSPPESDSDRKMDISPQAMYPGTFFAASENGIVVSRRNSISTRRSPWTCTVPGARVTLTWDPALSQ
ncbi:hypothetical protein ID866_7004 [Astraeus odoratus]|nr:hypothetical protein ID866_7004 [Astraeus odoratus]